MKLEVHERLALLQLLPASGDYAALKTIRRAKEMITMRARMELDKKDDTELFEWVLAHAAAFNEVRVNFNAALNHHHDTK